MILSSVFVDMYVYLQKLPLPAKKYSKNSQYLYRIIFFSSVLNRFKYSIKYNRIKGELLITLKRQGDLGPQHLKSIYLDWNTLKILTFPKMYKESFLQRFRVEKVNSRLPEGCLIIQGGPKKIYILPIEFSSR